MKATAKVLPVPLTERHLANARLLPSRFSILPLLKKGGTFIEVGVAYGDFSERVILETEPAKFIGVDLFGFHEKERVWSRSPRERFGDLTHEQYYRRRFQDRIQTGQVEVLAGDSAKMLANVPSASVDTIYVDAAHSYKAVIAELGHADRLLKPDGLAVLNDYVFFDHNGMAPYGVIQAANEFIVENDWEVRYFALHPEMFCDIVIARRSAT